VRTQRFCERCDIHLSLHEHSHPDDEREEWDCRNAEAKANLMDRFYSMGRRGARGTDIDTGDHR